MKRVVLDHSPGSRLWRFLAVLVAVASTSDAAKAERFEGFLRGGERVTGQQLHEIHDPATARLDRRDLFSEKNPVRRVRDLQQTVARQGMCVELTNGDVLPGRVVAWAAASPGLDEPARFTVALHQSPGANDLWSDAAVVRAECVRRVFSAGGRPSPETPGLIVARDGRRAVARSLRFTSTGAEALTDDGVISVAFADLLELRLPTAATATDLLRDGAWSNGEVKNPVVRIVTASGAELTYCAAMATVAPMDRPRRGPAPGDYLAIRPAWALETILLNPAAIVSFSYRDRAEVPLSLLPAETVERRSMLHPWPWRRNANVNGDRLQTGGLSADLGVGMHSSTAVAFALPAGAREFSTWVGLDVSVGSGGCVVCRVHRDWLDGPTLWESDFLRGGQEPVRVGPLDVTGATSLVLEVDFGHEGRPDGADPWDLRDEVDWIDPIVTVDREQLPTPETEPARWIPQLAGWEIPESMRGRFSLRPFWDQQRKQWTTAMTTDRPGVEQPFELTRRLQVDLTNAVLPVAAANDNLGRTRHAIYVKVNGDPLDSSMNGVIRTKHTRRNETAGREWSLGRFREKQVQLSLLIEPLNRPDDNPMGLVWRSLGPRPLVDNLPADGKPIAPDIPLTSLTPLAAEAGGKPIALQPGHLTDGRPLEIRGWRFEEGFGVPTGGEITYRLDPHWRRFVAIIGLADGWEGAGPYSILLDGQLHWECTTPASFTRNTPALQIDVPIPAGHKTITLRVHGDDSHAAWAWSGFVE